MNTMSLMAFSKTPWPKLTCGFPVRTKVLQLPGSFATFVTLLLPRSRTLSAWVKGNWSTSRGSVNGAISGQRGPVRPHLAALSVTNFPHPAKGLRRSCARLNCRVSDTSKKRSSGHWHCHSIDTSIGLKGSNCWKRSNATCIPDRSMCSIFDHSAITAASPNTAVLLKTSFSNHFSFAKDFNSPDTAVFDKRSCSSSVKLAKAAKSPVTSVPVRSSICRSSALDKSSIRPPTRVWRRWRFANSVFFAKTSNEPETFVSSRSRSRNFGSSAISGCSEPRRSGPPKCIATTSQPCLGCSFTTSSGTEAQILENFFLTNFFHPKKSWTSLFWLIFVALPKGPCDTRKVVQVPLQSWFWYSQTSEHHLERFLLGAPFSFIFIHSISDAWDLFLRSRFYSTRQFQKLEGLEMTGNETGVHCFRFQAEMFWHKDVAVSVCT